METIERRTLSIPEVAKLLGLSRSAAYAMAADGRLPVPVIRVGTKVVVPRRAVEQLLGEPLDHAAAGPESPTGTRPDEV
jgi:excisionase family DNA binding protein